MPYLGRQSTTSRHFREREEGKIEFFGKFPAHLLRQKALDFRDKLDSPLPSVVVHSPSLHQVPEPDDVLNEHTCGAVGI